MRVKAVVDTNVLVSGIFWKGKPFEILGAWRAKRFALIVSPPILEEYRRVLAEMTRLHPSPVVRLIMELIELHAEMIEPVSLAKQVCTDPDDDKFLEAALAANAHYVISGDKALLRVKKYLTVEILRPSQFLSVISP